MRNTCKVIDIHFIFMHFWYHFNVLNFAKLKVFNYPKSYLSTHLCLTQLIEEFIDIIQDISNFILNNPLIFFLRLPVFFCLYKHKFIIKHLHEGALIVHMGEMIFGLCDISFDKNHRVRNVRGPAYFEYVDTYVYVCLCVVYVIICVYM